MEEKNNTHHIEIYVSNLDKTKNFILGYLAFRFELFQEWKDGFSIKRTNFILFLYRQKKRKIS